ncbi:MAG TPA: sulfatase-like hydrolase/transferase, partial [Bryobacteraceae bacterium]|nr:sulfatase-like hydrolase/transferase [Bryobacteraceae bacterium]
MPLSRRLFLSSLAASALVGQYRRPNIVWIMADDLGYGDLGCYGQKIIKTPNLDRMAGEGMRFTQAYAGCTVCAPSRSVLMTGYHMGHTSVRSNPGGVPILDSDKTVAEYLKEAGYKTGAFGKWGLGDKGTEGAPWKQGFDEFVGYLNQVHAHWFYHEFLYHNDQRLPLAGNSENSRKTYSHDVIADKALEFIRRNKDVPFYCYMPFTVPHLELLAPEDSVAPYRGKLEEEAYIDPRKHYADQPDARATYAGMVSRLD